MAVKAFIHDKRWLYHPKEESFDESMAVLMQMQSEAGQVMISLYPGSRDKSPSEYPGERKGERWQEGSCHLSIQASVLPEFQNASKM